MLTITTDKKHFKNILKVLTVIFATCGILLIIGTEGASDNNAITLVQAVVQCLQGLLLCGIAWVLNFIKSVIK